MTPLRQANGRTATTPDPGHGVPGHGDLGHGGAEPAVPATGGTGPLDGAPGANPAARAWSGMRTLVLDCHDRRRQVCEALGMSFFRTKALRLLATGPATMRELASRLTTDAPYTTVVIDDLERRGLVVRSPHPTDRRSKIVTVTPEGAAAARTAERILNEPPASVRALDPADLAALDRIVASLLAAGPSEPGAPPDGR